MDSRNPDGNASFIDGCLQLLHRHSQSYSMTDSKPDIKPSGSALGPGAAFEQEPEEHLHVSSSYNQSFVWAIKVPRFLLEQWEQVEEEGVELGTLVVDASCVHLLASGSCHKPSSPPATSKSSPSTRTALI